MKNSRKKRKDHRELQRSSTQSVRSVSFRFVPNSVSEIHTTAETSMVPLANGIVETKRRKGERNERGESDHGSSKLFGGILTGATRICRISGRRASKEKLKGLLPREKPEPLWLKYVAWFYSAAQFSFPARQTRETKLFVTGFGIFGIASANDKREAARVGLRSRLTYLLMFASSKKSLRSILGNLGGEGGENCSKNKGKEGKRTSRNNLTEKLFH